LGVEGSYPIDGPAHLDGTLLLPYMRLDALPRLHTATGSTTMAWPCRVWLPSPKARSAQPRCVSTEQSQCTESVTAASGMETSRARSSRSWAGMQIPAGRRCAREYEFVWQDCLPPRTTQVGARGRGKSWSQRLPPRHTRSRPAYHGRDVWARLHERRAAPSHSKRHCTQTGIAIPTPESTSSGSRMEPWSPGGEWAMAIMAHPWPCGAAAHSCDHDRPSACSSMLHVAL
jgi:hypothetical protein